MLDRKGQEPVKVWVFMSEVCSEDNEEEIMKDYQRRVILEKKELDDKIESLEKFNASDGFLTLDPDEMNRMVRQRQTMTRYSVILRERIENFK